jgi:hypothetical protein
MTTDRRETLRQYIERTVREVAREYGVTQREVREVHDEQSWYLEWWRRILADAASGAVIDARTLDALEPLHRQHLRHDYPSSIPAGYVLPEARATRGGAR